MTSIAKESDFKGCCGSGCRYKAEAEKVEACGLSPKQVSELQAEYAKIKKAFALACRFLEDTLVCPSNDCDEDFPECNGGFLSCGAKKFWKCWQRYFIEKAENEAVCQVCGCTQYNACGDGCYWTDIDLCSECAMEKGTHSK